PLPSPRALLMPVVGVVVRAVAAIGLWSLCGVRDLSALAAERAVDLCDHSERVADATSPEDIPDAINLGFLFASNHVPPSPSSVGVAGALQISTQVLHEVQTYP